MGSNGFAGIWAGSALDQFAGAIRTKLLALPSRYRSLTPHLTARDVERLDGLVRDILTEMSHEQFPADLDAIAEQYFSDLHASTEAHSKPMGGPLQNPQSGKQRGTG